MSEEIFANATEAMLAGVTLGTIPPVLPWQVERAAKYAVALSGTQELVASDEAIGSALEGINLRSRADPAFEAQVATAAIVLQTFGGGYMNYPDGAVRLVLAVFAIFEAAPEVTERENSADGA